MRKIVSCALVIAVALGFAVPDTSSESRQLVVKITSADPDTPVTFEAAYLFTDHDSDLQFEKATTPFSATAVSEAFNGTFRSVDGDGHLKVRLLVREEGTEKELASGEGAIVMLNELRSGHRSVGEYSIPSE